MINWLNYEYLYDSSDDIYTLRELGVWCWARIILIFFSGFWEGAYILN